MNEKSLTLPEYQTVTHGSVPLFLVHMESKGVHVKPFSSTHNLLDRRAQLLLDSSYADKV